MVYIRRPLLLIVLTMLALFSVPLRNSSAQKASKLDIEEWRDVLRRVKQELKKNYYDPSFHGMDIDARFELADSKMKTAESLGQLVGITAQVLLDLNDSHTAFIPPLNATRVDYGWRMQPVGSDCYVSAVRPGSDAEAKGLRIGDKVISIDGRPLDRTKVWLADYLYNTLRPQSTVTLKIEKPDRSEQQIVINAKVREGSKVLTYRAEMEMKWEAEKQYRLTRHRFHELSDDVLIWKMPQFDLSERGLADAFDRLKNRRALILDLRGNEGGYVPVLQGLAGYLFDSNVNIGDRRGRKKFEPVFARSQKEKSFKGRLVVLIDGASASAAECIARVVQIEKRGIVIGDRSSGSVMESLYYRLQVGIEKPLYFGISITEADVIMADGKSLEHVGVTPDELLLPTAQEMSLNLDPVMARAAFLVGIQLDPKRAGELFPIEWK